MTKADKFIKYAETLVDKDGCSRPITFKELEDFYGEVFHTTNGGSWYRSNVKSIHEKYVIETIKCGNKNIGLKLVGFKSLFLERKIPPEIKKKILKKKCAATNSGESVECDHKDGRYIKKYEDLEESDFQALHRNINLIKRQHCKVCKEIKKRFDATNLGYSVGWTIGDEQLLDNENACAGCFWYDIKVFNEEISKNYKL